MKKDKKTGYSFRITLELRDRLRNEAQRRDVPEAQIIRELLKKFLPKNISK